MTDAQNSAVEAVARETLADAIHANGGHGAAKIVRDGESHLLGSSTAIKAMLDFASRIPSMPAASEGEVVEQWQWCRGCHRVRSIDCYRPDCPLAPSDQEKLVGELVEVLAIAVINYEGDRGRDLTGRHWTNTAKALIALARQTTPAVSGEG